MSIKSARSLASNIVVIRMSYSSILARLAIRRNTKAHFENTVRRLCALLCTDIGIVAVVELLKIASNQAKRMLCSSVIAADKVRHGKYTVRPGSMKCFMNNYNHVN